MPSPFENGNLISLNYQYLNPQSFCLDRNMYCKAPLVSCNKKTQAFKVTFLFVFELTLLV